MQEGDIALYLPDGNYFTTLNETAYGGLSDEKGNSLTACDDIILLPVPDDELDQTPASPAAFRMSRSTIRARWRHTSIRASPTR